MLVIALATVSTLLTASVRDTTRPRVDSLPLATTRTIELETTEGASRTVLETFLGRPMRPGALLADLARMGR